jgi:serine-type D-Ala-D-Ala carboxypeptidase/endopeptidase
MKVKAFALTLLSAAMFLSLTPTVTMESEVKNAAHGYLRDPENTGLAIGIISGGNETTLCFGQSCKATGARVDTNSVFEIGSITKVFTGIMLADEVINQRMKLDDKIYTYIPSKSDAAQQVSLLQLSTHSSGAPRLADNFWASVKDKKNPYASYSEKELYAYLDNMQLRSTPGTRYSYSNVGTGILGNILCKQYRTSYEALVKKKVCQPLYMNNTTIQFSDFHKKHLTTGYSKGEAVQNWDFQDATAGQGALRSTLSDMMKFMRFSLQPHGELQPAAELASQVHFIDNKTGQRMGLGWHIGWFNEHKYLEHTGGTGGYRSFLGIIPGTNTGVIVLSNSDNDVSSIGLQVLKIAAEHEKNNRKTVVAN